MFACEPGGSSPALPVLLHPSSLRRARGCAGRGCSQLVPAVPADAGERPSLAAAASGTGRAGPGPAVVLSRWRLSCARVLSSASVPTLSPVGKLRQGACNGCD